jgi:SpoIID/LytB domain protein
MRTLTAGAMTALAIGVVLVAAPKAEAMPPETEIVIDGGGWGHGIGMPQWGAQAQAVNGGMTYDQILSYWYTGTGLRQAAQSKSRNDKQVPDPLRIGINYVQLSGGVREYRPFRWQDFRPVNGPVEVCLPGESQGACSFTANPGETWRYRYFAEDGGFCEIAVDGDYGNPVYKDVSACDVRLFWSDQPNTRVGFPGGDVARTFARGHIAFLGGVTVNGQTGFHFNVVLTLEEYMYGIGEVPNTWHMEALKAQAVAARTYGAEKAARNGLRPDCSCHLVWDTMDQAYRGWYTSSTNPITEGSPSGDRWKSAVDSTAGLIVVGTSGGTVMAETYYSSSTGGATENVSDMWGSNQANYPYLVSRPDPWSVMYAGTPTESSTIRWRHSRTAGQFVNALAGTSSTCPTAPMPGITELVDIEIVETHVSGSPRAIRVTGIVGGQVTSKTFYNRGVPCESLTGTLRSRLNIRGHFIHAFTYSGGGDGGGQGGGNPGDTGLATSVGYHEPTSGIFTLLMPGGSVKSFYFGNPADVPFAGDWTCDGTTTLGLYRVSAGYLFLRNTNDQGVAHTEIYYGNPGDRPIAGDWNGNGCETIGIYRPAQATFYLRNTNTQGVADQTVVFGNPHDVPLVGDWNGNGVTTVGVYRPSTRMVYLTNSPTAATVDITYFYSGAQAGDRIIVGDWNGDGKDTIGIYRPSTATFYLRNSFTATSADHIFQFGPPNRTPVSGQWGS